MRWISSALIALMILTTVSGPAFGQEEPDPRAEFRAWFATFREALVSGDEAGILSHIDIDRMWEEVRATCGLTEVTPAGEAMFLEILRRGIGQQFKQQAQMMLWKTISVERVKLLEDGREALVVTRAVDDEGFVTRNRWWFRRHDTGWRFFDQETVGLGLRMSVAVSSMVAVLVEGDTSSGAVLPGLIATLTAWYQGDFEEASRILENVPDVKLPGRLESIRQDLLGMVATWNGEAERALVHFDKAARANPDMGSVDLARAEALLQLGRGADALACCRRYLESYGNDPNGKIAEGRALVLEDRIPEALDAYRAALRDNPESIEALLYLAYALPEGKKQEVAEWFVKHPSQVESFWEIFDALVEEDEREAAVALLAAFRKLAPEDHVGDIAEGWLHATAAEYAKAAKCYGRALQQEKEPEQRAHLRTSYLGAMARSEHALEGYLTFPGSSLAFREVCGVLADLGDGAAILEVVAAHEQEVPDDLWLDFYRGQGLSLTGDYDNAELAYAAGMARAADDDVREEFRYVRVDNLHTAGKGLLAYGTVGPRRATFRDLALYFSWEEDTESLAALVTAHAEADRQDPAIRLYRGEILWILGDMESMVGLLEGLSATLGEEPDLLATYEDRLVRGLARLGRVKDALAVAKQSTKRDGDPWFEAVVHAVAGEVEETGRVLRTLTEWGYKADDFWADEDLARALATEKFAELKKRYPESE